MPTWYATLAAVLNGGDPASLGVTVDSILADASIAESLPAIDLTVTQSAGFAPLPVIARTTSGALSYFLQRAGDGSVLLTDFEEDYPFSNMHPEADVPMSSRHSIGPLNGHVYTFPGTYTVRRLRLQRTGPGTFVRSPVASTTITVTSQDAAYPGTATMLFSSAGDFAGGPGGAQTTTSTATALAHLAAGNRLLLRAGETTDFGATIIVGGGGCLGRYGAGANPQVRNPMQHANVSSGRQVIEGIDAAGTWDPILQDDPSFIGLQIDGSADKVIFNCVFRDMSTGVQAASAGGGRNFVMANCRVNNWHQYGLIDDRGGNLSLIGTSLDLDDDVANQTGPIPQLFGPYRVANFDGMLIQQCYMRYDRKTGFSQPTRIGTSTSTLAGNLETAIIQSHWKGTGIGGGQKDQTLGGQIRFIYQGGNKIEVGADFVGGIDIAVFSQATIENNVIYGTATRATTNQQSVEPWAPPIDDTGLSGTVASSANRNNTGTPFICRNNTSSYTLFAQGTMSPVNNQAFRQGQPIVPSNPAFDDIVIANNVEQMPSSDRTQYPDGAPQLCEETGGLDANGRPRPGSLAVQYSLLDAAQIPTVDHDMELRADPPVAGAFGATTGVGFYPGLDFSNAALVSLLSTGMTAGVLFLLDDWTTLRQNLDGTGAVTQAGDPVGWAQNMLDASNPGVAPAVDRRGVAKITDRGRQAVFFPSAAALITQSEIGAIETKNNTLFSFDMRFAQLEGTNFNPNNRSITCGMALGAATDLGSNGVMFSPRGLGWFRFGQERIRRLLGPIVGLPRAIYSGYSVANNPICRTNSLFGEGFVEYTNYDLNSADQPAVSNRVFVGSNFTWGDLQTSDHPNEFSNLLLVNNPTFTSATVQQVIDIQAARALS